MMNKKRIVFSAFSVILLFLVAACSSGPQDTGGAPKTPFLGGTAGLQAEFLEGNPPAEVTDGNTFGFKAIVSLKNNGETDIAANGVKVSLVGFLPSLFGVTESLSDKMYNEAITGKTRDSEGNVIEPVEIPIEFPTSTEFKFSAPVAGNIVTIFRANVCYKYQTRAVSEVCVLQNQIEVPKGAICTPSGLKPIFSSASPIQVNAFKQNAAGKNKMQFSFDIAHSGQGSIFDPTIVADCPTDSTNKRNKEDKVNVIVKTGIGTAGQLKCVGLNPPTVAGQASGSIKLINGKRSITCTQDIPVGSDFKKTVDITVDFNYLTNTDKEVLIKHLFDSGPCNNDCFCDPGENIAGCPKDCPSAPYACGSICCPTGTLGKPGCPAIC